jgi:hypothetical protein
MTLDDEKDIDILQVKCRGTQECTRRQNCGVMRNGRIDNAMAERVKGIGELQ